MSLDLDFIMPACPCCGAEERTVFDTNITHNLTKMASQLGIHQVVWRPEENGIEKAGQLEKWVEIAVKELQSNWKNYKQYEASNGWGTVAQFYWWLKELQEACLQYPNARIKSWR